MYAPQVYIIMPSCCCDAVKNASAYRGPRFGNIFNIDESNKSFSCSLKRPISAGKMNYQTASKSHRLLYYKETVNQLRHDSVKVFDFTY